MIKIDSVSFSYNNKSLVLNDFSLDINRNDFISIVGLSGCGKSTLLHLLAGFITPTKGNIFVKNIKVNEPSSERVMIFQEDAVFPWYSVIDNIKYPLVNKRGKDNIDDIDDIASHYINLVGLGGFKDFYPKQLSGGMKKRVDLARAYAANPEILLMDEPFGALDTHTRQKMQKLLLDLWEHEHKTILFVTHDISEAVFLSNRVVLMSINGGLYNICDVNFERPRNMEIKKSQDFINVVSLIENDILKMESNDQ